VLLGLFSRLDNVVEQSGFFKYQHIRMQYIITCPRAAAPFSSHTGPYPHEFLARMVTLGRAMMAVTEQYMAELGQERFFLRVGLAHGAAAGAVVGLIRAFYCVYGDTINTAARLCMLAKRNHLHCSEAFVDMLSASEQAGAKGGREHTSEQLGWVPADLDVTPRGRILVKGKGESLNPKP
jgi:class 3 adenylate cyclase